MAALEDTLDAVAGSYYFCAELRSIHDRDKGDWFTSHTKVRHTRARCSAGITI